MTADLDRDADRDIGAAGLRPFARQLASLCSELAQGGDRALLAEVVTELVLALEDGHACLPLAALAQRPRAGGGAFPDGDELAPALLASGLVADEETLAPLPLVLDGKARLYLRRHFLAERRLAAALRARLLAPPPPLPEPALAALRQLAPADSALDWQAVAVAAAVRASFAVITGGPGTGKTTTVGRLLSVLTAAAPGLQVALSAPTGKAAARLGEALKGRLPARTRPLTLHRLLEYLPNEDRFRRNQDRQLPHDLVVVDEASMVDLELMAALLAALKPGARLLWLGDKDQLASVATGQVLGDLCRAARPDLGVGRSLARFCEQHLGMRLPVRSDDHPLADVVVALRKNHRFADRPGLGAFAAAVAAGAADTALAALRHGHPDLQLHPATDLDTALQRVLPALTALRDAPAPEQAFALLPRCRILCAVRHGPFGVETVNARVQQLLQRAAVGRGNCPILITANDHHNGLFNGDLGVLCADEHGAMQAWFQGSDGVLRPVLPLRLPPHEVAWAMTVHKSQGSEFEQVLLLLPDREGPLLTAPLVYTAVTRARQQATVVADPALLARALATDPVRASGLHDALASLRQ